MIMFVRHSEIIHFKFRLRHIMRILTYPTYMGDYEPICLRIREDHWICTTSWSYWWWWRCVLNLDSIPYESNAPDEGFGLSSDHRYVAAFLVPVMLLDKFSKCRMMDHYVVCLRFEDHYKNKWLKRKRICFIISFFISKWLRKTIIKNKNNNKRRGARIVLRYQSFDFKEWPLLRF